ncbi:Gfo/Idh/MocA family protein [Planctomycetota bacterium]
MKAIKRKSLNRRQFLRSSAKTVGAALAFPTIITSNALGGRGGVPASERIVFAGIGLGLRGSGDLRTLIQNQDVQVVAVCDTRRDNRESRIQTVNSTYGNNDCSSYIDFREMLSERRDIDAILTATSDRNHALISIYAMREGKDVYSEKPGTMTIEQGIKLVNTQNRYGRVYQAGMQRINESNFIFCNELVRLGLLGEVKTVRPQIAGIGMGGSGVYMSHTWLDAEPEPAKEELWWDAYLGAVPWRPYNSAYTRTDFYKGVYDFYCSNIGEWGSHTVPQCMDAIGCRYTSPSSFKYVENYTADGMVIHFDNDIDMILTLSLNPSTCAVQYEGSEGTATVGDRGLEVTPQSLLGDYDKIVNDYRARTGRVGNHMRDLIDCIRSRRETAGCAQLAHRSMATIHSANICMWLKRDLNYNPVKEEFINDEAANRLRSRAEREPWTM